jgi:uncharacterized protein (DUF58 family)
MKWETSLVRAMARYAWSFKLTRSGRVLVFCGLASGFLVVWSVDVLTLYLFAVLFMVGLLAIVVNAAWRTRLAVSITLPDRAVAGTTLVGTAEVRNDGFLPAYDAGVSFLAMPTGLRDVSPDVYVNALARGKKARFPLAVRAARRGVYPLPPLRAFSAFPFRLLRSGSSRQAAGSLLVLPAFTPADDVEIPVSPRHQPGGVALTSHVGESPEYIGNREFRPGDSVRRLDMRAWARTGQPVVREYQEEYFLRLAVVLDTFVAGSSRFLQREHPGLEAAVSLTATLVDALSRGEYLLDIFAAGPELYNFRTGRGTSSFDSVLEILACIGPCHVNPFDTVTPALADELGSISTVLFVFLDWDASRRDMVRMANECGCETKVYLVRDGDPSVPLSHDDQSTPLLLTPATVLGGGLGAL